ncbi:MAG: hypothetical protein PHN60_00795 [Candidatus Gracilibacteria bacterium]|nr:hypothetical protein [Candidatus Gracilibacteria bacterium]
MNLINNITTGFFTAALLSTGINTAQTSDAVTEILNTRNKTIEEIERICDSAPTRNKCYTSELRLLFANLTQKDPATYIPSNEELKFYQQDMDKQLSGDCHSSKGCDLTRTQILLYSDVSKNGQNLSIWLLEETKGNERIYSFIGASKISSGYPDPKPRKPANETKFATGTGVYTTNPNITGAIGYRAEGTKNKNGIRGFGERGNRVYDVGPMKTKRAWNGENMEIRFMIHSTDPMLEAKFGSQASQGCLRIPKTINRFLEYSGALDAGYDSAIERSKGAIRVNALGLLGRNPRFSPISGSLLVIGNSDTILASSSL